MKEQVDLKGMKFVKPLLHSLGAQLNQKNVDLLINALVAVSNQTKTEILRQLKGLGLTLEVSEGKLVVKEMKQ